MKHFVSTVVARKWLIALGLIQQRPGDTVCTLHFKPSDFLGSNLNRGLNVVPSLNLPSDENCGLSVEVDTPLNYIKIEDGSELVAPMILLNHEKNSNIDHSYSVSDNDSPLVKLLKSRIQKLEEDQIKLREKVRALQKENSGLRRNNGIYKQRNEKLSNGELTKGVQRTVVTNVLKKKNFTTAQIGMLLSDKKRIKSNLYAKEDYLFAMNLTQRSPRTVTFLRSIEFPVMAPSTVKRKFSWVSCLPGPLRPAVEYIKISKYHHSGVKI